MNAIDRLHPTVMPVYFLAILLVAMFVSNPVISLLALLGGLLFCMTQCGQREMRAELKFYIPLFLLVALTNPLFSHNGVTPLFFMNGNAVTLEAITYGAAIALMVLAVLSWGKGFGRVMTSDKLVYLFDKAAPQLALMLSMSLRYIPMLRRQAKQISRAQKVAGMYSTESYFDRLRSTFRVISALIGWSLEQAVETSRAMRARGYGLKGHTSYSNYHFRRTDALLLTLAAILLAIVLVGVGMGAVDFAYYPAVSALPHTALSVAVYTAFGCLSLLPSCIELGEQIRWNYYRSKI